MITSLGESPPVDPSPAPTPTSEPSPTPSPTPSTEPSPSTTSTTLTDCGTEDVPCVVTLPGGLLAEFYVAAAVLVLVALAALIGSWGRSRD